MRTYKIYVDNLSVAEDFYFGVLGLHSHLRHHTGHQIIYGLDEDVRLILEKITEPLSEGLDKNPSTVMSFEVKDLDETIAALRSRNATFAGSIRKEGVGKVIDMIDPFGNRVWLIQLDVPSKEIARGPKVHNSGLDVPTDRSVWGSGEGPAGKA